MLRANRIDISTYMRLSSFLNEHPLPTKHLVHANGPRAALALILPGHRCVADAYVMEALLESFRHSLIEDMTVHYRSSDRLIVEERSTQLAVSRPDVGSSQARI